MKLTKAFEVGWLILFYKHSANSSRCKTIIVKHKPISLFCIYKLNVYHVLTPFHSNSYGNSVVEH